jgi:hypothetical protein
LQIEQGRVHWADASVQPAAALTLDALELTARALAWPQAGSAELDLSAQLEAGQLALHGRAQQQQAELSIKLQSLPLELAAPYLGAQLRARPEGKVSADALVRWQADPNTLQVELSQAQLDNFALQPEGQSPAAGPRWQRLALRDVALDLIAQQVTVGSVSLQQPRLPLWRDAQGRWMYQDWWRPAAPPGGAAARGQAEASRPAAAGKAWQWAVQSASLDQGELDFRDESAEQPLQLKLQSLQLSLGRLGSDQRAASPIKLSARLLSPDMPTGDFSLDGCLGAHQQGLPQKLGATRIVARRLPLHVLAPFVPELDALRVYRADGSFNGRASYEQLALGPRVSASGQLLIEGLRADHRRPAGLDAAARQAWAREDHQLISWRALQLDGVELELTPQHSPRVVVGATTVTDLFARLVVTPQGELNLQGLYGPGQEAAANPAERSANAAAAPEPPSSAPAQGAPAPAAARIDLGPTRMINGRIAFTDLFVKPNYSANLSALNGSLGGFSSQAPQGKPQLAELTLQGLAQETAKLDISGRVNPLAQPLLLDIRGQVHDLDLPPLSPYSVRYAGYGIERGKLSVDVRYQIDEQAQLTASNKITLRQLAFGDKTGESSLPVKLAAALLADRHGVIDVELPVKGSLNDPQFSIGGLIWRALGSLLAKAVTSPLSLLSAALGGSASGEQSAIVFAPGSKWLDASQQATLDQLAQAMKDKPTLQLTLKGWASAEAEADAYRRLELSQRMLEPGAQSEPAEALWQAPELPQGADYDKALSRLYRRSDHVDKPRNLIGLSKSVPVAQMEQLLLSEIPVSPERMQQLAAERANLVRSYLQSREIDSSRIFLGVPELAPGDAWASPGGQPRVDLELDVF